MAQSVTHTPTGESASVPEHCPIHISWTLSKNWSDYEAVVSKKPTNLAIHTLFGEREGPHKLKVLTGSSDIMAEAVDFAKRTKDEARQKMQTARATSPDGFKAEHKKQQHRESIQKARKALDLRQEELVKKRVVSLSGAAKRK